MQLAIQADDRPSLKDRRGVVKPVPIRQFCESNDCRDGVACEGRKHGVESTGVRGDRELCGISSIVRQASQDSLWATKNCDTLRLTSLDSRPDEAERVHGAGGKQRSLIGGDPHKILPRTESNAHPPKDTNTSNNQKVEITQAVSTRTVLTA